MNLYARDVDPAYPLAHPIFLRAVRRRLQHTASAPGYWTAGEVLLDKLWNCLLGEMLVDDFWNSVGLNMPMSVDPDLLKFTVSMLQDLGSRRIGTRPAFDAPPPDSWPPSRYCMGRPDDDVREWVKRTICDRKRLRRQLRLSFVLSADERTPWLHFLDWCRNWLRDAIDDLSRVWCDWVDRHPHLCGDLADQYRLDTAGGRHPDLATRAIIEEGPRVKVKCRVVGGSADATGQICTTNI